MDTVLLRILTLKSSLGFGMYADMTIQQLIDFKKKDYLRWVYFNVEGVSFIEDILIDIHISKRYRIVKPGKNPKLHDRLQKILYCDMKAYTLALHKKEETSSMHRKFHSHKKEFFKRSVLQSHNQRKKLF